MTHQTRFFFGRGAVLAATVRRSLILTAAAVATTLLSSVALADEGFVSLFDGKTLAGWTTVASKAGNWSVRDGEVVVKGEGGGWLSTDKVYGDFDFKVDYKVGPAGNSGVFIRAPRMGDPAYTGMEIQLLDDEAPVYDKIKPYQHTGSVYGIVAAKRGHNKPLGEWNTIEVIAHGAKVKVILNGTVITEADLSEHDDAVKVHPGIKRTEGYIGLQSHSEEVHFRNAMVKELK